MFNFQKPNLPDCGTVLICDKKVPLFFEFKNSVATLPVSTLPQSMAYHTDLQICHIDNGVFLSAPETFDYYNEKLSVYGAKVLCGDKILEGSYGGDCAYNILVFGGIALHNTKFTSKIAKKYFEENDIKLIHVNQGYTKCSTAPVNETAAITADPSVKNALDKLGFDCLLIDWNGVELEGFSYGFFGGASGRISENEFYISGNIGNHPSKDKITDFLVKHNMKIREGKENMPYDYGSFIFL